MVKILVYSMIYLGSILMVYNIYSYIRFARDISRHGDWEAEHHILRFPIFLLVMFLFGYLGVGIFGNPDLLISGILFGGSIFVCIIVYLLRRITTRVMINERMKAELMTAEASNRAKTSFLSNMSHEMRTPLNAIMGLVRLSQNTPELPDETRAQLSRIDASARHLLSLINDVLDMSMVETGGMELKEERFAFADMMNQVESIVIGASQAKGLKLVFDQIGEVDAWFCGDEGKLKKILLSVLDNAVKYTNAPGEVRCTTEQIAADGNTRTLRFRITDTGIGMSEAFLATVYDAFAREDTTNTNLHGGSGLGLSLTRELLSTLGGTIDIESQKGVGTAVAITLTLNAAEQDAPPAEAVDGQPEDAAPVSLAGRRVLIAEDIDLNAEILTDLLNMEEIAAERAENGQVALDMFSASEPGYYDAILMDLRMPVMDGLEATRRIRALERPDAGKIPILALTANSFEEDIRNSFDAGMNAHLAKPADIELLFDTLRKKLS